MAAEPLWHLESVSLAPARLRAVSLEITPGITAVLGPSGAGKTSLLNVLVGFERGATGVRRSRGSCYWVPQDGGLWPHCTAREHLRIVRDDDAAIDAMLETFDLGLRAPARPHELSRGEQARLSVARALLAKCDALVMDEPLAHVESARAGRYWQVILEHLAATGTSLIYSTHQPESVIGEAEDAICLDEGRVVYAGPVPALYDEPATPELMAQLGPGNWLTPDEAETWLRAEIKRPGCFRPEQIEIVPTHVSHIVVRSAVFRGGIEEVELHHINAALRRRFFHRPSGPFLNANEPALIRLRA